jgi:hypothetical protein
MPHKAGEVWRPLTQHGDILVLGRIHKSTTAFSLSLEHPNGNPVVFWGPTSCLLSLRTRAKPEQVIATQMLKYYWWARTRERNRPTRAIAELKLMALTLAQDYTA